MVNASRGCPRPVDGRTREDQKRPAVSPAWIVGLGLALAVACRPAPPLVAIGLVAPFEGRDRPIGYDVLFGARLAVRQWNAQHPNGPLALLVALDDGGDPALAAERARQLRGHPGLIAVIGHFRPETTRAAAPVYQGAGLLWVAPLIPADRAPEGALPTAPDQRTMVRLLLEGLPRPPRGRLWWVWDGEEAWFGPEIIAHLREQGWEVHEAFWQDAAPRGSEPVWFDGRAVHAGEAWRRWRQEGWSGPLLGGPGLLHPDLRAFWDGSGAVRVVAETRRVTDPAWVEAYRAIALGAEPGPYAPLGYDLAWVLLQARQAPSFRWVGRTGTWEGVSGRFWKTPLGFVGEP
ncbi:MAG: hypothetical protein C4313_00010 [Thermoflexus sp.]